MNKNALSSAIQGSKGGGDRKAIEAPDSLFSIANARIIDLVSEGEIEGFAHGPEYMLRDIYYDETPVQNEDGTRNFQFVAVESRYGTQNQSYIPGFAAVENELSIGIELKAGAGWSRSITNRSLSAVRVRIGTPALSKTNDENGDVSGTSVAYAIDLSTDGGPFKTVLRSAISGKASSMYERGHRIELPRSESSGWVIRVRRLSADSSTQYLQNKTYVLGMTEIVDGKFRYPMSALVATEIDASQFQSIPTRAFHLKGRIIRVPTNYDPVSRTYATTGPGTSGGAWDGTFKTAYSNNPAWVFYDLITHPRYGLGQLLDEHRVDKWSLYAIGQWCDETVPDGFGGTEPRMTCNLYLQQAADAWKVLGDLTSVFRAICYWAGGSIVPVADRPSDPVYTYHNGNVVDGSFVYASSSRQDRHSAVLVSYNDMSEMARLKTDYYDDADTMARFGFRSVSINAIGCTSRGQARRLARWLLLSEKLLTNTVTFAVGKDGTFAVPGQIVRIADHYRAGRRIGGRIHASGIDYVEVDAMPSPPPAPGDTLSVLMEDGVHESRPIINVTATRITVSGRFTTPPLVEGAWSVEMSDLNTQLFRVLSVARNDDGVYTIQCLQHNPTIFGAVDFDEPIIVPPTTVLPSASQAPPTEVVITSVERAGQVVASPLLTAEWPATPGAVRYRAQWQRDGGSWTPPVDVHGRTIDLDGAFAGVYRAKVEAINALGIVSVPTISAPYTLVDQTRVPGVIGEIQDEVEQTWDELQDEIAERIAGDQAEAFNRTQALAAEAAARAAALQELSDELWGTIEGLQTSINDIIGAVEHDPDVAYEQDDLAKSDGKLYRAIQAVPIGIPITDTAYWLLIGEYASLGDAVAATIARVNVLTTEVENLDNSISAMNLLVTDLQSGLSDAEDDLEIQAGLLSALSTRVTDAEGELSSIANSLTGLTAAIAGKADSSALQALEVRVTETEDLLESVATDITDLETALAGKASTAALTALTTRVTETENNLVSVGNQITALNTAIANKADASAVNDLTTRVEEAEDLLDAHSSQLTALNAELLTPFTASMTWNFVGADALGWSAIRMNYAHFPPDSNFGAMAATSTGTDPNMISPVLSTPILGRMNKRVRAMVRRRTNHPWEGTLYWATTTSAINGTDVISSSTPPPVGEWGIVEWDLTTVANWTSRSITQLRIDPVYVNGATVDIRWIAIGDIAVPSASGAAARALEARVTQTEAGITSTAADITTLTSTVMGAIVPGRNLITNPTGRVGTSGWKLVSSMPGDALKARLPGGVPQLEVDGGLMGDRRVDYWLRNANFGGKTMTYAADIYVSGGTGALPAVHVIGVYADGGTWNPGGPVSLPARGAWYRVHKTVAVPAGIVELQLRVQQFGGSFSAFYIRNAKLAQEGTPSAYSDDMPYSSATQMLQTVATQLENGQQSLMARHSMTLDVSGYITGWVFNNDGSTGTFDVRADRFSVLNPAGGAGLTWQNGVLWNRGTSHSFIIGQNFGQNGDLIAWAGPNPATAGAASKTNAVFYITNGGDAYFGGSLSAGILRNAVTTTTIQTINAEVTNGPFGTNGNPRSVVISFQRTHRRQRNALGSTGYVAGAGSNTATIHVFRRIAGVTAWVHTWTLNVTGSVQILNEVDGPDSANLLWGGSITVNDQSPAANTVEYLARVVAFTEQTVTHSSGAGDTSVTTTQNLTIISTEE